MFQVGAGLGEGPSRGVAEPGDQALHLGLREADVGAAPVGDAVVGASQDDVEGIGLGGGVNEHVLDTGIDEEVFDDTQASGVTAKGGRQLADAVPLGPSGGPQGNSPFHRQLGDERGSPTFHPGPDLSWIVHRHALGGLLQEALTGRLHEGHLGLDVLVLGGL